MKAPDITYRYLYPKDVSGPTFEIVSRNDGGAVTATSRTFTFAEIPKDKVLVLSNFMSTATPGATQAVTSITLSAFTSSGQEWTIVGQSFVVAADVVQTLAWDGVVYVAGREPGAANLRMVGTFDAGVASNAINFNFHGFVIPRGNAAIF